MSKIVMSFRYNSESVSSNACSCSLL